MQAGIPTVYAGTRFRSRLEARWAVFFDRIEWRWEYEPFDLAGYIPDFLIVGKAELLVEVKPLASVDALAEIAAAVEDTGRDVLALGATLFPDDGDPFGGYWPAGALNQLKHDSAGPWVAAAYWHQCRDCQQIAVHHATGSFRGRPCGHYQGDHYLGWADPLELKAHWAYACNITQWRAPA